MKIYNYDENGFFTSESIADESPLEKGVYLIPANSTTVEPLEHKEGFDIKFNNEINSFEYVEIKPIIEDKKPLTAEEIVEQILEQKIGEAKAYLASTDYKMTVDYFATLTEAEQVEIAAKRAEARAFIRANEVI